MSAGKNRDSLNDPLPLYRPHLSNDLTVLETLCLLVELTEPFIAFLGFVGGCQDVPKWLLLSCYIVAYCQKSKESNFYHLSNFFLFYLR